MSTAKPNFLVRELNVVATIELHGPGHHRTSEEFEKHPRVQAAKPHHDPKDKVAWPIDVQFIPGVSEGEAIAIINEVMGA